jgi:hypothetical protein
MLHTAGRSINWHKLPEKYFGNMYQVSGVMRLQEITPQEIITGAKKNFLRGLFAARYSKMVKIRLKYKRLCNY